MGIPSYFSYIIKNYSNIIRNKKSLIENKIVMTDLYMDCNSIIYDAVYSLEKNNPTIAKNLIEPTIINNVIKKIDDYIQFIKPTSTVFITFDGVAPVAKMEQQRTRRYKSAHMSKINITNKTSFFNTVSITPGTEFMNKLSNSISEFFLNKENKHNVSKIMVSGSNDPGEGEHKIFKYIRENPQKSKEISVYGLDSDLIMLSIFHLKYNKNIYIFRESPEFLKSAIPVQIISNEKSIEPLFMDIKQLSTSILCEMTCTSKDTTRIYDYVFMCFFLGNDFLPHFPAMNIRTHGIQALMDIYNITIGNYQNRRFISETTGKIQWKYVRLFIEEIAKKEHELLLNEYFVRDKFDKLVFKETTEKEKQELIENIPIIYRYQEKYISPQFPFWEKRYYKCLFGEDDPNFSRRDICINYLEGLEWVFKYYTNDCVDWRWKYKYNYPPLFQDLAIYVPHYEMDVLKTNNNNQPLSKEIQMSYILSRDNLYLLREPVRKILLERYPELYPETYKFEWAYCRYFWESHPILPEINNDTINNWENDFQQL